MTETAAYLVDSVIPAHAPMRQWIITVPIALRYRLAYDNELTSAILGIFVRALFSRYRRVSKDRCHGRPHFGTISYAQRFGSALNVNVHFHTIAVDGGYVHDPKRDRLTFVPAPPPTDAEVQRLVETVAKRVLRLLNRRGLLDAENERPDDLAEQSSLFASMVSASVTNTEATTERAGKKVRRLLTDPPEGQRQSALCFAASGFSLHAKTHIKGHSQQGKEDLLRYAARPPIAHGKLSQPSEGVLLFELKRKWSDGSTHVVLSPLALLEKLAALVPPRRANLVRYHGFFAPRSKLRPLIIAAAPVALAKPKAETPPDLAVTTTAGAGERVENRSSNHRRYLFAQLLKRTFLIDIEACPRCGDVLRLLTVVTDPKSVRRYLEGVGLPPDPPPIASARAPPQMEFCDQADGPVPF